MMWKTKVKIKNTPMLEVEFFSQENTMNNKLARKLISEKLDISEKDISLIKKIEKI